MFREFWREQALFKYSQSRVMVISTCTGNRSFAHKLTGPEAWLREHMLVFADDNGNMITTRRLRQKDSQSQRDRQVTSLAKTH
jgi:hypothetical protein